MGRDCAVLKIPLKSPGRGPSLALRQIDAPDREQLTMNSFNTAFADRRAYLIMSLSRIKKLAYVKPVVIRDNLKQHYVGSENTQPRVFTVRILHAPWCFIRVNC